MRNHVNTIILSFVLLAAVSASAQVGVATSDMLIRGKWEKEILRKTIDNGSWQGNVEGDAGREVRRYLPPQANLWLETKVIGDFSVPVCKRVEYRYFIVVPRQAKQHFFNLQANLCKDGSPPNVSREELAKVMGSTMMEAAVVPYTEAQEKTQLVRLTKEVLRGNIGKMVSEPLEDKEMLVKMRDATSANAEVRLFVTKISDLPQEGCGRVTIEITSSHPVPNNNQPPVWGFRQEVIACEKGNLADVGISMPMPLGKDDVTKLEERAKKNGKG